MRHSSRVRHLVVDGVIIIIIIINVFHKRTPHPTKRRTLAARTPAQQQRVMPQPQQAPALYTEADVQLAISDISRNQIQSIRRTEKVYKVPERTI